MHARLSGVLPIMALPRKNRLTSKKEIDRVFNNGRTVKSSSLFIKFLTNQKEYHRFVFIVPAKHIRLAVNRNKLKRILSGEVAKTKVLPKQGYDIVTVISKKIVKKEFGELTGDLRVLLSKI